MFRMSFLRRQESIYPGHIAQQKWIPACAGMTIQLRGGMTIQQFRLFFESI